jgi:site-specific DNA-adenine methylase
MIPYQGNKKKIANEILNQIPSAINFYDLFGGGGAIAKAASESRKWKTIHYNEINTGVYLLFKELVEGKFDFDKARNTWISREDFHRLKNEPSAWGGYVATCWSFGNGLDDYLYGRDKELAKLLMFALVNYDNQYFPKNTTQNERRLVLQRAVKSLSKVGGKELESLHKQQALQNLESLARLQSIEAVVEPTTLTSVIATNMDYRKVKIAPNSVIYCDIPYHGDGADKRSYNIKFDHQDFLDWAATRNFPVYFSEYEVKDSRFKCIWKKDVRVTMCAIDNNVMKTERLYWNGVSV